MYIPQDLIAFSKIHIKIDTFSLFILLKLGTETESGTFPI